MVGLGLLWTAGSPPAAVDRRSAAVVGAHACTTCHPHEAARWHQTYHRTMTQVATGAAVLAPFAGESLDALGFRATMTRDAWGQPHLRVVGTEGFSAGTVVLDVDVALTVGSHRYQQYVARLDRGGGPGELWRLPVAWHREEARWIAMNTAFLEPEGELGNADDYLRHLSRWNDNCVLCHNTEPVPGRQLRSDGTAEFATQVGEFGIACEACHGPGGAHVARHANPLRRLLAGGGDLSIAHPGTLAPRDESSICGRCHGNRIAADVDQVLRHGDGFLPGTDLATVSRPIFADARLAGSDETPFAVRFWPDGTPRLSAYEYQGLLQSPCYQPNATATGQAGLGCNHCHDMHGPTPAMQLRRGRDGSAACSTCHATPATHGRHPASVQCQDCHMPRITYGLLEGMISHRISNPDPSAWLGRHDQPDACTQCHVDRSRAWAAAAMPALGFAASTTTTAPTPDESWASRVVLDLHGGDPVQRALATHALAQPHATAPAAQRMQWLVDGLDDAYPAVRWMAWRALKQVAMQADAAPAVHAALAAFDPHAEPAARVPATVNLRQHIGAGPLTPDQRQVLEDRQAQVELWIGE